MLAELRDENQVLATRLRETHETCAEVALLVGNIGGRAIV